MKLVLILALALALRVLQLDTIPPGLQRDEAGFAYDAYSLLTTARDQYGRFLPSSFQSFGIWEYPLQYYLKIPVIALLGLNIFSTRFSVVIPGVVSLFLLYHLTRRLLSSPQLALLAAFLGAFSSWHFFLSRAGYTQGFYALVFLLWGTHWLLYGRKFWGAVILGLTAYTYPAYFFFLPAYLVLLRLCFKPKTSALLITTAMLLASYFVFWTPNKLRIPGGAFFYQQDAGIRYGWADKPRAEILAQGKSPDYFEKILHFGPLAYLHKITTNYADAFSPEYWLKQGRGYESNVAGFGNLLIYEPVFILLGAGLLLWQRRRSGLFLIGWVALGPLASIFTKDTSTTRLLHMIVPLLVLEAVGIRWAFTRLKPLFLLTLPGILFINFLYFDSYFRHMPYSAAHWWNASYLKVVELIRQHPDKTVYWTSPADMGYIYVLFLTQYPPAKFQKEAIRSDRALNIKVVDSFDRYHFVNSIDWHNLCQDQNALYIDESKNIPSSITPDGFVSAPGDTVFAYSLTSSQTCPANKF